MAVKGRLKDMSLVDIINIFHVERKTAVIHLSSELGYGRIYMDEGSLVHASYRNAAGAEAFYQLLAWEDGDFEIVPNTEVPTRTIFASAQSLLMEGVKRIDEAIYLDQETDHYKGDFESMRLLDRLLELGILEKVEDESLA